MNRKISAICFILLLFLLIGIVNAEDSDNETLQTIQDSNISKSIDNDVKLELTNKSPQAKTYCTLKEVKKTKVSLKASNVKTYFGAGSQFKVTLKDNKKKAIKNVKLLISINHKIYTKTTDKKGVVSLKLNLNPGTYKITTSYGGSSKYEYKIISNTITVKSTIKAGDLTKYYKNTKTYSATFYDTKGKVLKKTTIKYSIGKSVKTAKTDSKGVVKIKVDLTPQIYLIQLGNTKTGEVANKIITIKPTLEQHSFMMDSKGNAKYSVKVYNNNGKAYYNQKVAFNVDGKSYSQKSDKNGIATLSIGLKAGKHVFQAEYDGLKVKYEMNAVKSAEEEVEVVNTTFTHTISIPAYINVTMPYVFSESGYAVKTGFDGIIKLPKNDLYVVETSKGSYTFSTTTGGYANVLGYYKYLVPFDGSGLKSSFKKESLTGEGIIIYKNGENIEIEYQGKTENNTDLFAAYFSQAHDISETITYIQNNKIKAKITFLSESYDETGLRYNVAKYYGRSVYDFNNQNYIQITNNQTNLIKYANTNEPVMLSYFGNYIAGAPSQEKIKTKLYINGKEELEKNEIISYGLSENYNQNAGFEVLQSYAIVNEKVTDLVLLKWILKNSTYLQLKGISNAYSMFLSALETAWLADKMADEYGKDLNVTWSRNKTAVLLGGINLKDTYLHILNSDMGMGVTGSDENKLLFKLINSIYLPDIEEECMSAVCERYGNNGTNSFDDVFSSISNNTYSIAQFGEIIYVLCENNKNSTIMINLTSGVSNVITGDDEFSYKGSRVSTNCDCCSIFEIAGRICNSVVSTFNHVVKKGVDGINYITKNAFRLAKIGYVTSTVTLGMLEKIGTTVLTTCTLGVVTTIVGIHGAANTIKNELVPKKDWHYVYDYITLARDSPLQNKKLFNIPKSDGTSYDYVEVGINPDGSLNRENAYLVTSGKYTKLSKSETYKYFNEETWVPWTMPKKYQPYPVPF